MRQSTLLVCAKVHLQNSGIFAESVSSWVARAIEHGCCYGCDGRLRRIGCCHGPQSVALEISGIQALAVVGELAPNLVVADIGFGDQPLGLELVSRVKTDERLAFTPIVVLSGRPKDELQQSRSNGAVLQPTRSAVVRSAHQREDSEIAERTGRDHSGATGERRSRSWLRLQSSGRMRMFLYSTALFAS
jgi:hypothetical protein